MRKMEFTIEDNGPLMEIGQVLAVKEYVTAGLYSYMLENALGMSKPYPASEKLNSREGTVLEKKRTERFNVAVLGFDE